MKQCKIIKPELNFVDKVGDLSLSENFLYNGDNLDIMSKIVADYSNKIDIIYIDPPYNTGKKMGKYNDNYSSHEKWLNFIKPRIVLAKEFLSDNGVIFISIGENEEAHLKLLCNDIFEEKNKIASIIWQSKYTVANDKRGISSQTEYILVYAKDADNIIINSDALRPEYVDKTYRNMDNDPRGLWRSVQLYKKKNKYSYKVISPTGKEWTMPWNYSEEQWHNVLEKEQLIYWGKDGNSCPSKKVFIKDTKGTGIRNLWLDEDINLWLGNDVGYTSDGGAVLESMFGDRNEFLYPKPVSLMKRILQVASQPNSLTMDFFAGSGTWGHAILEYNKEHGGNRRFILITDNENNICDRVAFPRIKKVINGYIDKKGKTFPPSPGRVSYYCFNKK